MLVLLVIINCLLLAWIIYQNKDLIIPHNRHSTSNSLDGAVVRELNSIKSELKSIRTDLSRTQKNQKNVIPQIQEHLTKLYKETKALSKRLSVAEKVLAKKDKSSIEVVKNEEPSQPTADSPVQFQIEIPEKLESTLFLKNFRDGILMECRESDAQFSTTEIFGTQASFRFCGDVATAIATKDATFSGVCELIGWHNEVRSLTMIEDGVIRSYSEGKWEVTKLAKIKCK